MSFTKTQLKGLLSELFRRGGWCFGGCSGGCQLISGTAEAVFIVDVGHCRRAHKIFSNHDLEDRHEPVTILVMNKME